MIKLIKPYITYEEVEADFREIFESGWFTKGKHVDKFREVLKTYTGAKNSFLTTSATTALAMSLKAIGIKAGDEVVISDFSFPATVNVVEELGARPVFADVSLETFNMLPDQLEKKITSKTKAVIFVDALGNPSGIHDIKEICKKKNLVFIEDAACAVGSSESNVKCGNIADFTCFSFHPRKLLTTGEGGAITVNNDEYAEILERKLNHGANVIDGKFDFTDYGYNYRLPELQAAMGVKQIAKLDNIVESRNSIRKRYISGLKNLGFIEQKINDEVVHNVQSMVFKVPAGTDRDMLITLLKEKGIETTLGTYCLSGTTYYRKKYNDVQPHALYLDRNTITFPCYDEVDVEFIVDKVRSIRNA